MHSVGYSALRDLNSCRVRVLGCFAAFDPLLGLGRNELARFCSRPASGYSAASLPLTPPSLASSARASSALRLTQSGWRDLNPRPLRPERSALPSCATPRTTRPAYRRLSTRLTTASAADQPRTLVRGQRDMPYEPQGTPHCRRGQAGRATKVSSVASGRHANRTGAYGFVPNPAHTWNHIRSSH